MAKPKKAPKPAKKKPGRPRLSPEVVAARLAAKKPVGKPRVVHAPGERIFNSMTAMAGALGVHISVIKRAKNAGCPAFMASRINESEYLKWVDANPDKLMMTEDGHVRPPWEEDEDNAAMGSDGVTGTMSTDEKGVSKAYARAQGMEQYYSKKLDVMMTKGAPAEALAKTSDLHIKYVKLMVDIETKLEQSKKDAGALLPKTEVVAGIQALVAWLNVAFCTVARPLLPELEGKNRTQMASIITPALHGAILRSLANGIKTGRLPEYIVESVTGMLKQTFNLTADEQ